MNKVTKNKNVKVHLKKEKHINSMLREPHYSIKTRDIMNIEPFLKEKLLLIFYRSKNISKWEKLN